MEKVKQTALSVAAVFMAVVLLVCMSPIAMPQTANAGFDEESLTQSGDYYYSIAPDGTAWLHGYTGSAKNLTVPTKIKGLKVTGMSESLGYLNVETIKIHSGITYIEGGAFTGAPKLKSITVDEKNKKFTAVDGILFNKNKTELIQYPGGKEGTEYTVPKSVTSVGAVSFYGNNKLTKINLHDKVTSIGNSAFASCTAIKSFVIPDGVKEIGFNTFSGCTALESVVIPATVTAVRHYAFNNCPSLKQIYFLGSSDRWGKITVEGMNDGLSAANVNFVSSPAAVSKITLNKATETSLKFSWSKATDATGYKVVLYKGKTEVKTVYTTKLTYTFKKLKKGTTYKVKVFAYKNVNGGKALSVEKVLSASTKVAKVTLSSVKSTKTKQAAVAWKTVSGANGYEVTYSTSKKFTKKTTKTVTVKKQKTKKTTLKKLKKGKKYFVKVRAYKTVNGKKIYGAYSSIKTVKVK